MPFLYSYEYIPTYFFRNRFCKLLSSRNTKPFKQTKNIVRVVFFSFFFLLRTSTEFVNLFYGIETEVMIHFCFVTFHNSITGLISRVSCSMREYKASSTKQSVFSRYHRIVHFVSRGKFHVSCIRSVRIDIHGAFFPHYTHMAICWTKYKNMVNRLFSRRHSPSIHTRI